METKEELTTIEKRLKVLNKSIISENHLFVAEQESEYLMKGFATELIDKVWVFDKNRNLTYAKIYGVQAKDQSMGRYVWIYLFYNKYLYKCHNLKFTFDLIEKLKEVNELERKAIRLNKKINSKQKLLEISKN